MNMSRIVPPMAPLVLLLAASPMPAAADPFPKADVAAGRKLVTGNNCAGCHVARLGGDPSRIYLRPDRKVTTPAKLLTQMATCSTELKLEWFPEEEENAAAFLNREYYRFK